MTDANTAGRHFALLPPHVADRNEIASLRAQLASEQVLRQGMVSISSERLYTLTLSHVRYSLGRSSYIVSDACDWVRFAWAHLDEGQRATIARDVRERLADWTRTTTFHGSPGGDVDWQRLLEWMDARR